MPSPNPSSVRKVELETGKVLQKRCLPKRVYGEGIVNWKDRLIQITYNQGAGFIYGLDEFDLRETFRYKGQGWGLTQDGRRLIVSDGTNKLQFWDPKTLKKIGSIRVVDVNRSPVHGLNALQWVKGEVWANVNNWVARINPRTGKLTSWFDLSVLFDELTCEERKNVGVLNGIAYDDKRNRLFVTGKEWPYLFEIRLVKRDRPPTPPRDKLHEGRQ